MANSAQAYDLFNPDVQTPQPTETLRYSQGTQPDQSFGTLFSGLGDIATEVATGSQKLFQTAIREEIAPAVDEITDRFTGRGPSPAGAGPDSTVPDEITRTGERLSRLTTAERAGTVLNSHYWGLLDMEARRLRAKYPGFRDYIDNVFQDMTGSVPANALRRSLMEEAKAHSANDPQKIYNHWEEHVINQTPSGPEVMQRKSAGNPMTLQELQGLAAKHASTTITQTQQRQALEFKQLSGNVDRHSAMKAASDAVWSDVNNAWRGPGFEELMKTVQEANARVGPGGSPQLSPQEQAHISQLFTQFKTTLNNTVRLRLAEYGRLGLHQEDGKAIQQNIDNTLKSLEDDVNQGRTSLVASYKSMLEGMNSADQLTALSTNEQLRRFNTLRQSLGPEGLNLALLANAGLLSATTQAATNLNLSTIFGGVQNQPQPGSTTTPPPPSINDVHEQNKHSGITDSKVYTATRKSTIALLTGKDVAPIVTTRAADALYGDKNINYLQQFPSGTVRNGVFQEMTTPAITQKMKELRDQGDTQSWNKYSNWVTTNAAVMALQPSQDLIRALADPNSRLQVNYNQQTHQLELASAPPLLRRPGSAVVSDAFSTTMSPYAGAARVWVQQLNQALLPTATLGGAAQAEGGEDQAVRQMLQVHGLSVVPDPNNANQLILKPIGPGQQPGKMRLGGPTQADMSREEADIRAAEEARGQAPTGRMNAGVGDRSVTQNVPEGDQLKAAQDAAREDIRDQGKDPDKEPDLMQSLTEKYMQQFSAGQTQEVRPTVNAEAANAAAENRPFSWQNVDQAEYEIEQRALEEGRKSQAHWARLYRDAVEKGDTEAATRYQQRLQDIENQIIPMEQRLMNPAFRASPQDQIQQPQATPQVTGEGATPPPQAGQTVQVQGDPNKWTEIVSQYDSAPVGTVLRIAKKTGSPKFVQKTQHGWLLLDKAPQ